MQEEEIAKKVGERMAQLPADVRAAVESAELGEKVAAISTAHKLHIDQAETLNIEVYLVMLGLKDAGEFTDRLASEVHIPKDEAAKIAADVNAQIFNPIRESLKRAYEEGPSGASETHASPAAPAASAGTEPKSVVMPSAAVKAPAAPSAPAAPLKPVTTMPAAPAPSAPVASAAPMVPPAPLGMPKPPVSTPDLHAAQTALTQKTVQLPTAAVPFSPLSIPQKEAPKPGAYAADPYREPIE